MFTKTLLPDTFRAIQLISNEAEIKEAYLAGGTALALQLGHRISVDLDFFTQNEFDETKLLEKLATLNSFVPNGTAKWTIWGKIGETKFSMFYYKYPLLEEISTFEGIRLASLADIAAMKVHAVEDRGTRRDFVDLYFLSKKYTFKEIVSFYQKKYSIDGDQLYSTLRALDYFEDAEQEEQMPKMIIDIDWKEIKGYFQKETRQLLKDNYKT